MEISALWEKNSITRHYLATFDHTIPVNAVRVAINWYIMWAASRIYKYAIDQLTSLYFTRTIASFEAATYAVNKVLVQLPCKYIR